MKIQFPKESEGLGAWGNGKFVFGLAKGVNDEVAALVDGFKPTGYELEILAQHYLEEALDIEFFWECDESIGSGEMRSHSFAWRRVNTIAEILGEKRYKEATAGIIEEWEKKFEDLAKSKKNVSPCKKCGVNREWGELIHFEDYCHNCSQKLKSKKLKIIQA